MSKFWKKIRQKYVYEHYPYLKVRKDTVIKPDKTKGKYTIIEKPNTVVIIAKKHSKICLVSQWRYPIKKDSIELPMGLVDPGENEEDAAIRELKEETGFLAKKVMKIGEVYSSNGMMNKKTYVFFTKDFKSIKIQKNPNEFTKTSFYSYHEIKKMILKGEIDDSPTIIGLWYYENRDDML